LEYDRQSELHRTDAVHAAVSAASRMSSLEISRRTCNQ
jgi:hypothetical protein